MWRLVMFNETKTTITGVLSSLVMAVIMTGLALIPWTVSNTYLEDKIVVALIFGGPTFAFGLLFANHIEDKDLISVTTMLIYCAMTLWMIINIVSRFGIITISLDYLVLIGLAILILALARLARTLKMALNILSVMLTRKFFLALILVAKDGIMGGRINIHKKSGMKYRRR